METLESYKPKKSQHIFWEVPILTNKCNNKCNIKWQFDIKAVKVLYSLLCCTWHQTQCNLILIKMTYRNSSSGATDHKSFSNISLFAGHRLAVKYNEHIYISRAAAEELIIQHKKRELKPFCYVMYLFSL